MSEFDIEFQEAEDIPTSELDKALDEARDAEAEYRKASDESKKLYKIYDEKKQHLISLMDRAKKTRWETENNKGFSMVDKLTFRVPASPEDKAQFFKFLNSEKVSDLLGADSRDIFLTYASIHSAKFNTLCKELKERAAANGEDLELPGVQAPKSMKELRSLPGRK